MNNNINDNNNYSSNNNLINNNKLNDDNSENNNKDNLDNINNPLLYSEKSLNKTSSFVKDDEKERNLNKLLSNFNENDFNILMGETINENNNSNFIPVPFNDDNKNSNISQSSISSSKKIPGKIYSTKQKKI
jgi:hypothetical protein